MVLKQNAGEFGVEAAKHELIAVAVRYAGGYNIHALVGVGAAVGFPAKTERFQQVDALEFIAYELSWVLGQKCTDERKQPGNLNDIHFASIQIEGWLHPFLREIYVGIIQVMDLYVELGLYQSDFLVDMVCFG